MSDAASERSRIPSGLKMLWKNGIFKSLLLLVIVVLSVLIFREVLKFALRTEYPLQTPISRSMEPTLNIGDLLFVQGGFSAKDIRVHLGDGEVIVFRDPRNPNEFIVHRAVDKYQEGDTWYLVTKGDNNGVDLHDTRAIDNWVAYGFPPGGIYNKAGVPESYLIGKVLWRIPFLGYVKIYLGTPVGMIVTILLIVVILFIESVSSERTDNSQTSEEKSKG